MKLNHAIATCLGVVALSLTGMAQNNVALLSVARVQVKPDRVGEFMDLEKQYTAAYKKGGGRLRAVYRNSAGNPFEFLVIADLPNYAALDGSQSPYAKGTTATELARMADRRNQCVDAVRTTYERPMNDLGFNPPDAPQPSRVIVVRVTVRPEMVDQFMATVKNELAPALKKAGQSSFLARRVEWGGSQNIFSFRSPLGKFAELDGPNLLVKGLGPEAGAKLGAKLGSMGNAEFLLYTYMPELSLRQQP
jgi:quinol monooxygenase YgiN